VTAADLARHVDPQHLGPVRPPRRADLYVAAADRHVIGVHHDARFGDQYDVTAAHLRVDLQRRMGDDGLRKIQLDVAASYLQLHPLRHHPAAVFHCLAAAAVQPHHVLDPWHGRAGHVRRVRQVGDEPGQLAVRPRGHGHFQPLVEFLRGQPPVSRGHSQQLDHPVPVVMRGAQLATRHYLAARF
jgi:hypothetical protein